MDFDEILSSGRWPVKSLLDTVLLASSAPGATEKATRRPGTVAIESYHNTEVTISVTSPDGGWVVLNDIWHPWWTADINGAKAPIERANVLVRAVLVPAGHHRVRFTFQPLAGSLAQAARHLPPGDPK